MTTVSHRMRRLRRDEAGMALVHVGVALLVLMGLSAFVIDKGVLWLARGQAQNTADAGALAGATALLFDNAADLSTTGPAYLSALNTATQNKVFNQAPTVKVFVDPKNWDPAAAAPAICGSPETGCVQVDVYRDGTNSSGTLPTYFGLAFGATSQGVRATATAMALTGNGSGCMRPWFIPQRYNDVDGNNRYDPGKDTLNPYSVPADIGTVVTFHNNSSPSSYGQLDVGNGGDAIRNAIENCVANTSFFIGQTVQTKPGGTIGPEKQGIDALLSWDPKASYDSTQKVVVGGCSPSLSCKCPDTTAQCPYGGTISPRIVQAAVCDPSQAACDGSATGTGTITITDVLSFFITGYTDDKGNLLINAILVGSGGLYDPTKSQGRGFVKTITLVR
jgi:Flp pilus assembly protein TadG